MEVAIRKSDHAFRLRSVTAGIVGLALWVFGGLAAVGVAAPGDLIPLTKGWLELRPSDRGVPQVEESVRLKMIAELHELIRNPDIAPKYARPQIDTLLVDLGDDATIDRYVTDQFSPGDRRTATHVLPSSKQPIVIARLGPSLLRDEPINEIVLVPRTVAAAQLCLTLVQRCPEFSQATKRWAAQLQSTERDRAILRSAVRAFWLENEAFLKAKNYQAVRPPNASPANPPPVQAPTNHANPAAAPQPAASPGAHERPGANPGSKPTTPPVPVLPAPAPAPPPAWPWMLGVGGLLACLLWWRSRSGA